MNAQQLKNAILQEAIEGRLVPQDPNDEPASALLARIRKEKERLVKAGKLKKKDLEVKPISEEEIPFEIPESWVWCRISRLFETSSGSTPQSKNPKYYSNGNINWVRTTDLNNGALSSCEIRITKDAVADYHLNIIPRDSICIAMYGGGGTIGKHSIIKFDTTINQSVCAIYPNGICNMDYLHYFMQYQRPNWMDYAAGSRKDPNINQIIIKNCLFPLPPLAEQQRIVDKLNKLLPKVEEYGKAQDALNKLNEELPERLKKSILQEAIEGRLVPQDPNDEPTSVLLAKIRKEKEELVKEGILKKKDLIEIPITEDEIPFDIPETWEWCRVKTILNVYSARRVHEKDWRSSGIPFYRAREIGKLADTGNVNNDLFIDKSLYDEFSKSGVPLAGDLMVTAVGTLGKTYIVKEGEVFYYKDGSVLCFNNRFHIDAKFLKYYIESPAFIEQYANESQGTTVATLTMVRVNEYLIPLPPLAEQYRIVEKLEQLLGEIDKLKK